MRHARIVAGFLLLGLLGACRFVSDDLASVKGMSPKGDAFQNALFKLYVERAEHEYAESHLSATKRFLEKASAGAGGVSPAPEEPAAWGVEAEFVGELNKARERLVAALNKNASKTMPDQAAKAQVFYDCWVEEQSENFQPEHIKACKNGFADMMAQLEKPAAPAAQPAPPAPPALPGPYIVYFEFDAIALDERDRAVLQTVVADAKKHNPSAINVTGHTDRSGPEDRNMRLSERRAQVVAAELKRMGVSAPIVTFWAGEDQPRKPTPDGVKETENRRAEIVFMR